MPAGGRLLELGCGTGTEAVVIARVRDARITALDPSQALLAHARAKARAHGLAIDLVADTALHGLQRLKTAGERFDGVWASFSLAYDQPVSRLAPLLSRVTHAGAPFVVSLPNPWVVGAPWQVPGRARGTHRHKVGVHRLPLRCTSLRQACMALAPWFVLERATALPLVLPPSRYGRVVALTPRLTRGLKRLDRLLARQPLLRALGDHTLMVFRRTEEDACAAPSGLHARRQTRSRGTRAGDRPPLQHPYVDGVPPPIPG